MPLSPQTTWRNGYVPSDEEKPVTPESILSYIARRGETTRAEMSRYFSVAYSTLDIMMLTLKKQKLIVQEIANDRNDSSKLWRLTQ